LCRHIGSARHPIPDVPVIYLLEPNAQNLQAITSDLQKELYTPAYINFLSSLPRPLLEEFATQTATAGTSEHIAQLFDQYLNFIVAEPDLFSLGMQKEHTYWALNSAATSDEELDRVVDKIVSGLFSVIATMGMSPVWLGNSYAHTSQVLFLSFDVQRVPLPRWSLLDLIASFETTSSTPRTTSFQDPGQTHHQAPTLPGLSSFFSTETLT
jgi:hypothetical protein